MLNSMHTEELRLSRELAKAIEQELQQFGQVIPQPVLTAYLRLNQHYQKEIEEGVM